MSGFRVPSRVGPRLELSARSPCSVPEPELELSSSAAYDATVITESEVPGMLIVCDVVTSEVKIGLSSGSPRSSQQWMSADAAPVFVNWMLHCPFGIATSCGALNSRSIRLSLLSGSLRVEVIVTVTCWAADAVGFTVHTKGGSLGWTAGLAGAGAPGAVTTTSSRPAPPYQHSM